MKKALNKSFINYFSDLFIVAMVVVWILETVIMTGLAIYSTVRFADNSIWPEAGSLVAMPLSCGGAIWMVKNSVQHAIANYQGRECPRDFPAVDASEEIAGQEKAMAFTGSEKPSDESDNGSVG